MQFAAIQGYDAIKQRLVHMAQTRHMPHAQLWSGPVGSGSLPLALAFATYLNCQHPQPADACGQCPSCTRMGKLVHPDVKFVFPTAPTKQVAGKEVHSANLMQPWRSFITTQPYGHISDWGHHLGIENKLLSIAKEEARQVLQYLRLRAFEGGYKMLLLWLPECLNAYTANALLKVIEEPPPRTLFLLISTHPDRVLGTILSRTQHICIPPFTDEALSASLAQQHDLAPEALSTVTMLAAGDLNKAQKLASQTQPHHLEQFKTWMRLCYTRNLTQLAAQSEAFQRAQRAYQKNFLIYALQMLRESLVISYGQGSLSRTTQTERSFTQRFGQTLAPTQVAHLYTWINQAVYHIERNANPGMLYLNLSLKIMHAFQRK